MAQRNGTGIFPHAVMNRLPLLPLEEEGRLNDVPLTLLQHHLRRHPVPDWVWVQVCLRPYPKELVLRNRV